MFTKIFYVVQEQFPKTDTANEPGLKVVGFIWLPQTGFATLILYLQWSFPSHNNVIW